MSDKTKPALLKILADAVEECGSQKAFAHRHGISPQYVSDVLSGRRDPGKGIALTVGYEPITVYRPVAQKAVQA